MNVQVTQSALGAFVPQFLLNFKGDSSLQNYFRRILKNNYEKGVVKLDFGHCQSCCLALTYNDGPRIRSSQPKTGKLHKLLTRSSSKPLGKYHAFQVNKFLQSSTLLTVRCPSCSHVNKMPIISNEGKMALKDNLLMNSEAIPEPAPSVTKKKKRKKKQQKDENCGLIIPVSKCDQNKSAVEEATYSPMEVSQYSPLAPEIFSTPVFTRREVSTSWGASVSTKTSNKSTSKTTSNKSTHGQNYFQKRAFSTPVSRNVPSTLSDFQHRTSQPKGRKTGQSSVQGNKKMKHKHLQEFLSHESSAVKKPASLADFLSSL